MNKVYKYLSLIGILMLVSPSLFPQRVYIEDNQFKINGKQWWINGANTPWDHWNDLGGNFDISFWNNHFIELNKAGINATRIWLSCNGAGGVNITDEGYVTGPTNAFWEDMDSLMNIARRHKVYIMGALISFDHTKEGNPKYLAWRKMYADTSNMKSFTENYAVPLVKRYADNPYLFSIDICNEIIWVSDTEGSESGQVPWSDIQYLLAKTAQRIHEESEVLVCESNYIKYVSPNYNGNKYSDAALQKQVPDADAYLDFYKIHYYSWVYPWFDGFHAEHTPDHYGIAEKPCITGEMAANRITGNNASGSQVFSMSVADAYELHFQNGWQGAMAWTSNGVDGNGDLNNNLRDATLTFLSNHFELVGKKHSASNPGDPNFNYIGRIDRRNILQPAMQYAGNYIHTKFGGTSLKVVLSSIRSKKDQDVLFVIDSLDPIEYKLSKSAIHETIDVAMDLTDTIHELYIAKLEGPGTGAFGLEFNGLVIDNDTAIYSTTEPDLKIEVYGDSFTEGVGGDCIENDGDCGNNNAWYGYANVLARKLNARIHNNGIGGLAVLDNTGWYQSKTTGFETTYDKLIPTNENGNKYIDWDFSDYTPDLMIFAFGINDQYTNGFEDTVKWKITYKALIRELVNHRGEDVKILVSPGNINTTEAYRYSKSVVREMKNLGYSIWYHQYSFELSAHPNRSEHALMAQELYDFIQTEEILGDTNKNPRLHDVLIDIQNGHVEIVPDKDGYQFKEEVTITAFPDEGYVFSGWSGDTISDNSKITLNVERLVRIKANMEEEPASPVYQNKTDNEFKIYPNPVKAGNDILISSTNPDLFKNSSVFVYSVTGDLVHIKMLNSERNEKTVSLMLPLSRGFYILALNSQKYKLVQSIIIK